LFEIVDRRLSKWWVMDVQLAVSPDDTSLDTKPTVVFAFPVWIDEPTFLERLTDNEEREVSIFSRYRSLMDAEATS
jgi:hypothetical protein